jgi:hypothetical protein
MRHALLTLLTACSLLESPTKDTAARDTATPAAGTDPSGGGASDQADPTGAEAAAGWTERTHPCPGDGVDAMWWDEDEQTVWIGCGTNTEGYGLHRSADRGQTWPPVSYAPDGAGNGRVNAISRSADGMLYLAGEQLLGGQLLRLDTRTSPYQAELVYDAGATIDEVQFGGSFARTSSGFSVLEAINGTQIAARATDDAPWQDAAGWAGGRSHQVQHLLVHDDAIYGVGSTMIEAPMVFLPPPAGHDPASGFQQVVVSLSPYAQELRTLAIDASGALVAGGVDHGLDSGVLYLSGSDPYDPATWTELLVSDLLGASQPTWIDGVCRHGDTLAAVGRASTTDTPIALLSTDGGARWEDLTGELRGDSPLYRCQFLDEGQTLAVAGAGGFLGFYGL